MRKRLLSIFAALLLVFVMVPMNAGTVFAEDEPVVSGEKDTWTKLPGSETISYNLNEQGTLKLQGSGEIPDYDDYGSNVSPFYQNRDVKSAVIGDGITKIGKYTFLGCEDMRSISLPKGLRSIGKYAFVGSGLRSIEIPDSVNEIGGGAFSEALFLKTVKLPSGITEIQESTFGVCVRLKGLEIPDGVKSIGRSAFADCTNLREITIPESVKMISNQSFFDCISLEKVIFEGDSCVEMGAFYLCDFTAYYPLHNATWDEEAVECGYGGKVKWIGYCDDPKPMAAVKKNVKAATVFKAGSYDSVVYCSVCGKEISRRTVSIAKLKPTIKLSATRKTLKKGKTYTLKVSGLAKGDAVKSFKTSRKTVAAVTSKGKIKAKNKGKALITVTLKSGKKATCKITVK